MKGTLGTNEVGGYVVNYHDENDHTQKKLPLHPGDVHKISSVGFILGDYVDIEFEKVLVYVEPPDNIHCNRGDDVMHARLVDKEKKLYRDIENAIIMWSNDGTKTAGTLTREIINIIDSIKNNE